MKRIITFVILAALCMNYSFAKKVEALIPDYQIEGAGPGRGDEALVRVYILTKDRNKVDDNMLGKAAVHGVLFKGYTDTKSQGFGGASNHTALAGSPMAYNENIDFFEPFFSSGDHMNYVRFIEDQRKVTKVGKDYKVSAVVRVSTGQLKKDLQSKNVNVIRSLKSGW